MPYSITLSKEYAKSESVNDFVKGTTHRAVAKHEFGHLLEEYYGIDPYNVARKVTGIQSKTKLQQYVVENLSKCAGSYFDGTEIISESFASVFGSTAKNEFALKIVQECNKNYYIQRRCH